MAVLFVGCRREAPPSFSVGPAVQELTADLDDPEEIELFENLQLEIEDVMVARTGTPEKIILLGDSETSEELERGYSVYSRFCVQCHGITGDGDGPVAKYLDPKPRNYTLGVFKFTSTPYGGKPRRSDLVRTIRHGVAGTSMPSFDRLSDEDVDAVVSYILALAYRGSFERALASYAYDEGAMPDEEEMDLLIEDVLAPWEDSSSQLVMPVTPMPPMTKETIEKGHQVFVQRACSKCHGVYGRGGAVGNVDVGVDVWGNKAAAADLSSGMLRGGDRPIDIYRRIYSGINGTPMPAFSSAFEEDPDTIWHLVHFVKATGDRRRRGEEPLSEKDLPAVTVVDEESATSEDVAPVELDADTEAVEDEESEGDDAVEEAADEEPAPQAA